MLLLLVVVVVVVLVLVLYYYYRSLAEVARTLRARRARPRAHTREPARGCGEAAFVGRVSTEVTFGRGDP